MDAVCRVPDIIQGWNNPFTDSQQELISNSTVKAPPKEVATDLQKAHEIGEKCYDTFKKECMESVPHVEKFHDPMKY